MQIHRHRMQIGGYQGLGRVLNGDWVLNEYEVLFWNKKCWDLTVSSVLGLDRDDGYITLY